MPTHRRRPHAQGLFAVERPPRLVLRFAVVLSIALALASASDPRRRAQFHGDSGRAGCDEAGEPRREDRAQHGSETPPTSPAASPRRASASSTTCSGLHLCLGRHARCLARPPRRPGDLLAWGRRADRERRPRPARGRSSGRDHRQPGPRRAHGGRVRGHEGARDVHPGRCTRRTAARDHRPVVRPDRAGRAETRCSGSAGCSRPPSRALRVFVPLLARVTRRIGAQIERSTSRRTTTSSPISPTARISESVSSSRCSEPHAVSSIFACLLIDLDRFKEINDTLGHHAGRPLLRQLGHAATELARDEDTVARLGGDEFALLLPRTRPRRARAVASRGRSTPCGSPFAWTDWPLQIEAQHRHRAVSRARRRRRRRCCSAPTSRCTRPSEALGLRDLRSPARRPHIRHRLPRRRAAAGIARRARRCTTSRRSTCDRTRLGASRRSCAGSTRERGLMPPDEFIPVAERTGADQAAHALWSSSAAAAPGCEWLDAGDRARRRRQPRPDDLLDARAAEDLAHSSARGPTDRLDASRSRRRTVMADPTRARRSSTRLTTRASGSRSTTSAPATRRSAT